MGVNGQKLYFLANVGRWRDNGVETAWNSFLIVYIFIVAFSDNIFVNRNESGVKGPKIKFLGKWQEIVGQWGGNSLE